MKQGSAQRDHGQDLNRKHDLFDEIDIAENECRRARYDLRKKVKDDKAGKQNDREIGGGILLCTPTHLQDRAEQECVNRKHEKRRQQRPQGAKRRAAIARGDFAMNELAGKIEQNWLTVIRSWFIHVLGRCHFLKCHFLSRT